MSSTRLDIFFDAGSISNKEFKKCSAKLIRRSSLAYWTPPYLPMTEFVLVASWPTHAFQSPSIMTLLNRDVVVNAQRIYRDHLRLKLEHWMEYCKTFLWSAHKPYGRLLTSTQSERTKLFQTWQSLHHFAIRYTTII